jgi:hypothetical protein
MATRTPGRPLRVILALLLVAQLSMCFVLALGIWTRSIKGLESRSMDAAVTVLQDHVRSGRIVLASGAEEFDIAWPFKEAAKSEANSYAILGLNAALAGVGFASLGLIVLIVDRIVRGRVGRNQREGVAEGTEAVPSASA